MAGLHGADRNLPESMLPPCAELRWMPLAATPLLVEACVHGLIRRKALRTPICAVCLQGERDYQSIRGGTGPLVYPAGFLYLFSGLRAASGGGDIAAAQVRAVVSRRIGRSDGFSRKPAVRPVTIVRDSRLPLHRSHEHNNVKSCLRRRGSRRCTWQPRRRCWRCMCAPR